MRSGVAPLHPGTEGTPGRGPRWRRVRRLFAENWFGSLIVNAFVAMALAVALANIPDFSFWKLAWSWTTRVALNEQKTAPYTRSTQGFPAECTQRLDTATISKTVQLDMTNGTAFLRPPNDGWWCPGSPPPLFQPDSGLDAAAEVFSLQAMKLRRHNWILAPASRP